MAAPPEGALALLLFDALRTRTLDELLHAVDVRAELGAEVPGEGVLEVLGDGVGFLRAAALGRRMFPAIELSRSEARRAELLQEPATLNRMLEKIRQSESNEAFLASMNS